MQSCRSICGCIRNCIIICARDTQYLSLSRQKVIKKQNNQILCCFYIVCGVCCVVVAQLKRLEPWRPPWRRPSLVRVHSIHGRHERPLWGWPRVLCCPVGFEMKLQKELFLLFVEKSPNLSFRSINLSGRNLEPNRCIRLCRKEHVLKLSVRSLLFLFKCRHEPVLWCYAFYNLWIINLKQQAVLVRGRITLLCHFVSGESNLYKLFLVHHFLQWCWLCFCFLCFFQCPSFPLKMEKKRARKRKEKNEEEKEKDVEKIGKDKKKATRRSKNGSRDDGGGREAILTNCLGVFLPVCARGMNPRWCGV